jgi:hypothetical protein
MKIKAVILTFVITLALGACRKQTSSQSQPNTIAAGTPEAPFGGTASTGEKLFFRGNIAGSLSIEMVLLRDGERVTGTYMYPKIGKDIALTGTIDKDGNVNLAEADETGKQTGIFKEMATSFDSPDSNIKEIEGSGRSLTARRNRVSGFATANRVYRQREDPAQSHQRGE